MSAERVLVTGATGCLGSNLTSRLLLLGHKVTIFKPHGEPLGPLADFRCDMHIRFGDVRDPAALASAVRAADVVYHLAAITAPLNRLRGLMWDVNVMGTLNVAMAAAKHGVRRLVHVSSSAAIGYPPEGTIATEDFAFADSVIETSYGTSKRQGERAALAFDGLGVEVVVVNPSAVLAPGGSRRFGWAAVVDCARRARLRAYPSGGSAFCAGQDLVSGLLAAAEQGRPGERYILSTANLSYRQLAELVCSALGLAPPQLRVPRAALTAIGRIADGVARARSDPYRSPVLVSENTELMSRTLFYNQSKAVSELGMSQSSLTEAIRQVAAWCDEEDARGHAVA
jgi:dihydroflavonol-4-reductase